MAIEILAKFHSARSQKPSNSVSHYTIQPNTPARKKVRYCIMSIGHDIYIDI